MSVNKSLASCPASECIGAAICIGERKVGSKQRDEFHVYIVAEKVRTTLRLASCRMQSGAKRKLQLVMPLQFTSSHATLATFYDSVCAGNTVTVFALGVTQFGSGDERTLGIAEVGALHRLLTLTKPSKSFKKRTGCGDDGDDDGSDNGDGDGGGDEGKGPDQPDHRDRDPGDGDDDGTDLDPASDGLNLLLEHIQAEEEDNEHTNTTGNPEELDLNRLEMFCHSECHAKSASSSSLQEDTSIEHYIDTLAASNDEAVAAQSEKRIINEVQAALAKKGGFVNGTELFEHSEGMGTETFDETVDEAVLNQVCGNEKEIIMTGDLQNKKLNADSGAASSGGSDQAALLLWVTEMVAAVEALNLLAGDQTTSDGTLGLVTLNSSDGPQVVLFQWVIAGKTGRVADLDESSRVKMIVPVGHKRHPIQPQSIILLNTGIHLEKVKRKERPTVPKPLLRLVKMWEAASESAEGMNESGEVGIGGGGGPCSYCKQEEGATKLHVCSWCLQSSHQQCVQESIIEPLSLLLSPGLRRGTPGTPNHLPQPLLVKIPAIFLDDDGAGTRQGGEIEIKSRESILCLYYEVFSIPFMSCSLSSNNGENSNVRVLKIDKLTKKTAPNASKLSGLFLSLETGNWKF